MLYTVLILILVVSLLSDNGALEPLSRAFAWCATALPGWVREGLRELGGILTFSVVDIVAMHWLLPLSGNGTHSMLPSLMAVATVTVRRALGRAG